MKFSPAASVASESDDSREESLAELMSRVLAGLKKAVDYELEPAGLTHAQWVPLLKIYRGDASTVAELARKCHLDVGAMTRTLDRLESKCLIQRSRSEADRRVVNLALTVSGNAAAKRIPATLRRLENELMAGFSQAEGQLLEEMLRRMLSTSAELQRRRCAKPS